MPASKKSTQKRAKRLGFPKSNVVKAKKGGYYIAPKGVKSSGAKKAYANCRAGGGSKAKCARISHSVQKRYKRKKQYGLS